MTPSAPNGMDGGSARKTESGWSKTVAERVGAAASMQVILLRGPPRETSKSRFHAGISHKSRQEIA